MSTKDLFKRGEEIRREVLGEGYVANSAASTDAFSEPMREFAIKNLWGDVWDRPGLDRRARSIVNLALLSAANRPSELKVHLRGALNNGVTREEISEIFLQVALYCGIPTGSDATRIARLFFAEYDAEQAAQAAR
ncbi:4-carboxymuconolactone decarboxylase [Bordetella genomosp. 10]|uniref:4-carboxymuconolactone decarboxylase n=1 Tax=Bordetella genomosp. 10 TaxID=1416804 RepID=A0A261SAJ9_9BORD|nr:carboxymuconolactone decarboxylase family protein [Bordetella genomosp. 10]OZI34195.1 4-carboxymuconolactone decarboxylase [Bordetella genomosp. 10]